MPLDMAQFLRNSVPVDRYEAVRTASLDSSRPVAAAEHGTLMGTSFVVAQDPVAELMDSMEELSFQFEEKETKDVSERKLGESRDKDNPYVRALENWQKTFPDLPGEQFTRMMLSLLRQARGRGELPTPQELLHQLAEGSGDPSHQFAMLDVLEQALGDGETDFRGLVEDARRALVAENGARIRAGINLASEVNARATSPEEMQDLRDMYRGEVLGFTTPQQCFRSIMSTRGAAGLAAAVDFLVAGCGVDLQSASPSMSPVELRRIILDLQCVHVLRTVLERMNGLEERMAQQFNEHCRLNGEQMTGKIMDFTEFSFVRIEDIRAFIASCGIVALLAKMDFCRELTEVFRQLSSRLFANEQDRLRLIDTAQEHLDGLVDEEFEDDEDDDERQEGGRR